MPDPVPSGGAAVLVIDMINRLDFPGADRLRPRATAAADAILRLRDQADAADVPLIFCNDNHGQWHHDRTALVTAARESGDGGRALLDKLSPRERDILIVKPQVSAFYATNLPAILPRLGVSRLVLVGVAADICVLFTAGDAHMREYRLWVPADAVASEEPARERWALEIMAKAMGAQTRPVADLPLADWLAATA